MAGPRKRVIGQGLVVAAPPTAPPAADLYRENRWAWAAAQLEALQRRDAGMLDWDNLISEVRGLQDDMASGLRKKIGLAVLHLLKIRYTDHADSYLYWEQDYMKARRGAVDELKIEPDLKNEVGKAFVAGWLRGRRQAVEALAKYAGERGRDAAAVAEQLEELIPKECPWSLREVVGCDLRGENPKPSRAVIPDEIRDRLCAEGAAIPCEDKDRPVDEARLIKRARERGGEWLGLGREGSDDKDSADQSAAQERGESMAALARAAIQGREPPGGGGRGR